MMKTISIVGSAKTFLTTAGARRAWPLFFQYLESQNYSLTTQLNGDYLVAVNHNEKMYKKFIQSGGHAERTILIRLEPDSVFPAQHTIRTTSKYGLVISPGSVPLLPDHDAFIGWPYQYHLDPSKPNELDPTLLTILENTERQELFQIERWRARPRTLTLVAANKVSPLKNANYLIRRNLAKELSKDILEVYGPLWNDSLVSKVRHRLAVAVAALRQGTFPSIKGVYGNLLQSYPTAKGTVANKHALLQQSRFSLVIENSNSFVTEKIFDAMLNGSIPIYVGANLNDVGLPTGIAIPSTGDPKEIMKIIRSLQTDEVENILMSMHKFLQSPTFWKSWEANSVYEKLSIEIANYFARLPE